MTAKSDTTGDWKAIQRAVGVAADGVPGPATARAIIAKLAIPTPEQVNFALQGETLVTGTGIDITRIVLHCTATREGQDIDAATIRKWHKDKGWFDIGYHFVVRLDGSIEKGRTERVPGSHVKGFNTGSIGVVYVGGLDSQGQPKDTRTPTQRSALALLVGALAKAYPKAKVMGHRDLSPDKDGDGVVEPHEWLKACPCFDARAWWAEARR